MLWNFRTPGCLAGALIMAGICMEIVIRRAQLDPRWLAVWQSAGPVKRNVFFGQALLGATISFLILLSATMMKWETSRFHWNAGVVSAEAFEAKWKGKEYQLIRHFEAFKDGIPTTELSRNGGHQSWGFQLWGDSGPSLGMVNAENVVFLLLVATLILLSLSQQFFGADKLSVWRWNIRAGWRPALAFTAIALSSATVAYGTVFLLSDFQLAGKMESLMKGMRVAATVKQVDAALNRWAEANHYAPGDTLVWNFETVPKGEQVAQQELFDAWKPSPFEPLAHDRDRLAAHLTASCRRDHRHGETDTMLCHDQSLRLGHKGFAGMEGVGTRSRERGRGGRASRENRPLEIGGIANHRCSEW